MNPDDLYSALYSYFPETPALMKHLNPGALWQYEIMEHTLDDGDVKLYFNLEKISDEEVSMKKGKPGEKPDLILFFTQKAILHLIKEHPAADVYFREYKKIMQNPSPDFDLDNKVNKSKITLFKKGYRKWQTEYHF